MRKHLIRAWLAIGLALFAYVVTRTPLAQIARAVTAMGPLVVVSPVIAAAWFATRTSALSAVIGGVAPWHALYRLRWIGDGYNGVIPLAGVGGEPFKLRILGRYLSVEQSLTALVRDRLIDNGLGFVVSAACCALGVVLVAVPAPHAWLVYAAVALPLGLVLLALMISRVPGRLGVLVGRAFAGHDAEPAPLPVRTFVRALAWFAGTRVLQGCETALLLALISAPTDAATILFVDGTLNAAGFLGFMLPQGLGVVEGTAAFVLTGLGVPLPAATAFALARRGRVLACGMIAVVVHGCTAAYQRRTRASVAA
ncbi:MAG: lysylphosphatidylglycerol synthase transmembrane domain-containing protein [Kofleriaceae bacterium]